MFPRFPSLMIAVLLAGRLAAHEMHVARTPVLTASLAPAWTWQVESSSGGGPWIPTGVLVAGAAAPVTVRLDGFPADQQYRFQSTDGKYTASPTVGQGLHLAGSGADGKQAMIETAADPAIWSQAAVVMPDADGNYVRAIREPLASRAFFRSVVPETPLTFASVTYYAADPNTGASGFGPVADDMPAIYQNNMTAAVFTSEFDRDGINAAASGECYELTGPAGTATVMINEVTTLALAGTLDSGRHYFDLSQQAFEQVVGSASVGIGAVSRRLVPAPVSGNVKLLVVYNSGGYYTELRPYNHRAGVDKMEIKVNASSVWTQLPRTTYNSFVHSGAALAFPVSVRVTSRFGESVVFPSIPSMTDGQRITGPAQFNTFPALAPEPVWLMSPVYQDGLSTTPGDSWACSPYSGTTVDTASPGAAYKGPAGIAISGLGGFNGVAFTRNTSFAKPDHGVLGFAIRASSTTALGIRVDGTAPGGASVSSAVIELPPVSDAWQVFRIPLTNSNIPATITGFSLVSLSSSTGPTVWMDEVSFIPH